MARDTLIAALEGGEDFLLKRLITYSAAAEYTRYTSTKEEDWRVTVREPLRQLVDSLRRSFEPEALHVDEDPEKNPIATFGILEARLHRQRGVRFEWFLGLAKLMRQTFLDLVYERAELDRREEREAVAVVGRFFDKFELGFASEWARGEEQERLLELQGSNRSMTNEKNRYLTIFRSMAEPAFVVDPQMTVTEVNPALERLFGRDAAELRGLPCSKVLGCERCQGCPLEQAMRSHDSFSNYELSFFLGEERRTALFGGAFLDDISGKFAGGIGIIQDITKRKQVEEALRERELHYRTLIDNMPEAFAYHRVIVNGEGDPIDAVFLDVNSAFERLVGRSRDELIGRRVTEMLPAVVESAFDWLGTLGRVGLEGEPIIIERYLEPLERWLLVSAYSAEPGTFAAIFVDVTERYQAEAAQRELDEKLRQTQKLESLGVLAGGIAHDFNNLLVGILGNAGLAMMDLSPASPVCSSLQEIELAAQRAAELCKQMLAYAGKGRFRVQRLDLNEIVREMTHLLEVSISKSTVIKYELSPVVPAIEADATQVRQVIMNLITNASEAISGRSGVISLATGAVDCDRAYLDDALLSEELPEGLYAFLEVSDTGCGMDEATRARIFEPFFSTKLTGRGLGLAAVMGIIRGHCGALRVYSELGKGTTFKLLLPAAEGPAEPGRSPDPASTFLGSGKVLLVDDDETVRAVARRTLERAGFEVITANDGREGVALFAENAEEIRCVVLDLTMPKMDGEEAFRELRRIRADVRVLLSSGYNEQNVISRFLGKGLAGFVQKPFTPSRLLEAIRLVLDEG